MGTGWQSYRWEIADLSSAGVQGTFTSTAQLPEFMFPPFVSKELLKRMIPHYQFRRYATKITDFGKGKSDTIVIRKDITSLKNRWGQQLTEFQTLPNTNMQTKLWSVKIDERGLGFPFTERLNILADDDPIAILEQHVGLSMQSNVDVDLLENAISKIDYVYISQQTGGVHGLTRLSSANAVNGTSGWFVGQNTTTANGTLNAMAATVTFGVNNGGYNGNYGTITLTQGNLADATAGNCLNPTTPGSSGSTYYKDVPNVSDLKYIKTDLLAKRCPRINGSFPCIINAAMLYWLLNDTEFKNVVAYSLADRFVEGELGTVWGFTFVLDDSGAIDDCFTINPGASQVIPAVAIIFGADCIREAVAMPEHVRRDTPLDAGRFHRLATLTYRAEAPTWFTSEGEYRAAIYIGKPQP
jgi:hypothetical protein